MAPRFPGAGGYEPRTSPAERRDFFDLRKILRSKTSWAGVWSASKNPYDYSDLVTDEGWTMVCVEPGGCTERPAPQPFGDPFWVYEGTSPTASGNYKTVTFGNRYTFDQPGYLTGYRIWTVAGNLYRVFSVVDPGGANEISELPLISSATGGWVEFGLADTLVGVGTTFELACIVSEPGGTDTPIPGDWLYDTPQNTRIPGNGEIVHANSSTSVLSVSKQDINGPVDLTALTVGDTVDVSGNSWAIQSITDETTYWNFGIAPAVQIAPDGVYEFTFNTVIATPISFLRDPDYWPTTPYAVQGLFGVDGASPVLDDNAYGTDIKVQPASISDQWEAIASGGSGTASATPIMDSQYETVYNGAQVDIPNSSTMLPVPGTRVVTYTNPYSYDVVLRIETVGLLYLNDSALAYLRYVVQAGSEATALQQIEYRSENQVGSGVDYSNVWTWQDFRVPAGDTSTFFMEGRETGTGNAYIRYFNVTSLVMGRI